MRLKKAFTLIELLIVVAIIAILAAIAVPNFLEAQTRAKVTSVVAACRNIATAIEAYRIDNKGSLPNVTLPNGYAPNYAWTNRWYYHISLSTPVSYMTSIPQNKFMREYYMRTQATFSANAGLYFFQIQLLDNNIMKAILANPDAPACPGIWFWPTTSLPATEYGRPDLQFNPTGFIGSYFIRNFTETGHEGANYMFNAWGPTVTSPSYGYGIDWVYDPSNGTISAGNIPYYN